MICYRASWILPINEPPIRDGWISIDGGHIIALGHRAAASADDVDLGHVALMPGLVNAHTHLELSYLRNSVPPGATFPQWVRDLVAARQQRPDPRTPEILEAIDHSIGEAVECGTAVIGDISNTLVTFAPLARSPLAAAVFYELIRFNTADPAGFVERACQEIEALVPTDRVRASLAAHAPYSVAPLVFRAIRQAVTRDPLAPWSVHLSESVEEVEFIRAAAGPWREFLEEVGAWDPAWIAPAVSPVEYLDTGGFLDARTIVVHGVQMTATDLTRLAARGTTLVTCPRSNRYTGAGTPPIEEFYNSGVRVAVGTDSLASAPDLNVFTELAMLRALAPSVPASVLLDSATRQGARALGFDAEYGTLQPGKRARLLVVDVESGSTDVEEDLVAGIPPEQIRWLE